MYDNVSLNSHGIIVKNQQTLISCIYIGNGSPLKIFLLPVNPLKFIDTPTLPIRPRANMSENGSGQINKAIATAIMICFENCRAILLSALLCLIK